MAAGEEPDDHDQRVQDATQAESADGFPAVDGRDRAEERSSPDQVPEDEGETNRHSFHRHAVHHHGQTRVGPPTSRVAGQCVQVVNGMVATNNNNSRLWNVSSRSTRATTAKRAWWLIQDPGR